MPKDAGTAFEHEPTPVSAAVQMALAVESGVMNGLKPGHPVGAKPALKVREYFAAAGRSASGAA